MALELNFTCVSSDASATINVARSSTKAAPEGMVFTVDVSGFDTPGPDTPDGYNAQHHELNYYWDFGDPGSSFNVLEKVLPHQRDANTMTGPVAGHCYETPGTYTVSVMVMEPSSGKTAYATLALSGPEAVRDPDMIFLGNKTYYMDTTGAGVGRPAGSLIYDNIESALNHARTRGEHIRFMFKDGQVWNIDAGLSIRNDFSNSWGAICLAGEGGASPAIIRTTPTLQNGSLFVINQFFEGNGVDFSVHNLNFEGGWDETTETNLANVGDLFDMSGKIPDYIWFHRCRMDGFNSTVNTEQDGEFATNTFGVSACDIGTFLNTGMYINTFCPTAIIGNKIARAPDALAGGRKLDHNAHGAIRSQHTGPCIWAKNDLFNNAGWFPNVFGYATQQPPIRLLQSGYPGGVQNISQNTLEGGFQVLALSRQDNGFTVNPQNIIVDGNILIGGFHTANLILGEFGGVTVRNNLGIRPNVPTMRFIFDPVSMYQAIDPAAAGLGASTAQQISANFAAPIRVYNNTYAMLTEDANFDGPVVAADMFLTAPGFTTTTEANNVVHAPNATASLIANAPLDTTVLFTPRMLGYRGVYELVEYTLPNIVADGDSFTVPYPAGRSAADYGPATSLDPHGILIDGTVYNSNADTTTFSFGASAISITNRSGDTWPAITISIAFYARSNPPPRQPEYATPLESVATYAPLAGSAALGDALADPASIHDFYGDIRPFYPSRGAFELSPGPGG